MGAGKTCCFLNFRLCRTGAGIGDILGQCPVKQDRFLLHNGDLRTQRCLRDMSNILPVNLNGTAADIIETLDQLDESRLTRAGMANQTNPFTGFNLHRKITVECCFMIAVMESHLVKADFTIADLNGRCIRLVGNAIRFCLNLYQFLHIIHRALQIADMHADITQITLQHEECCQNKGDITGRCFALAPQVKRKSNDNTAHYQQIGTLNKTVQSSDQPCAACTAAPFGDNFCKSCILTLFSTKGFHNSIA